MSRVWSYLIGQTTGPQPDHSTNFESREQEVAGADWEFVSEAETPQEGEEEFILVPVSEIEQNLQSQIPESTLVFGVHNIEIDETAATSESPVTSDNVTPLFHFSQYVPSIITPLPEIEKFDLDKVDGEEREAWLLRQQQKSTPQSQVGIQVITTWGSVVDHTAIGDTAVIILKRKSSNSNLSSVKGVQVSLPGGAVVKGVSFGAQVSSFVSATVKGLSGQQVYGNAGKSIVVSSNSHEVTSQSGQHVMCAHGSQVSTFCGTQSKSHWGSQVNTAKTPSAIQGSKGSEVSGTTGLQISTFAGSSVTVSKGGQVTYN